MASPDRATVLIVDDEPPLVELFEQYLKDEYETRTATDGEAALAQVDGDVDVALLDRRIPGMTGDEILEAIRERGYQFPIAMITAVNPGADIVDMPFDDYVTKPVDRAKLTDVVSLLLERKDYDEKSREFFQLATKRAALEASPSFDGENRAEYRAITRRMKELKSSLTESLESLSDGDMKDAYRML
ncbi:Rec domain [Halanaeroarchaeum sp. HSR-CO]|uniref:response regulator n=1 Tax=Halanaeroarchaeum sp. HSR-CO TaxID=2866382 RepID=UPI00217E70B9|nr:response regulator [Halanaeroarchaeum sp. HSR-CO]UWG48089.1 Rec domain [Halanaeroarchaeum sp. HSR-CO]